MTLTLYFYKKIKLPRFELGSFNANYLLFTYKLSVNPS